VFDVRIHSVDITHILVDVVSECLNLYLEVASITKAVSAVPGSVAKASCCRAGTVLEPVCLLFVLRYQ